MKKALIVQGGWEGHEPALVSERFANLLRNEGFEVEVSDTLDSFSDAEKLLAGYAVSVLKQEDGYSLIHGKKEELDAFLKELRQKVGKLG